MLAAALGQRVADPPRRRAPRRRAACAAPRCRARRARRPAGNAPAASPAGRCGRRSYVPLVIGGITGCWPAGWPPRRWPIGSPAPAGAGRARVTAGGRAGAAARSRRLGLHLSGLVSPRPRPTAGRVRAPRAGRQPGRRLADRLNLGLVWTDFALAQQGAGDRRVRRGGGRRDHRPAGSRRSGAGRSAGRLTPVRRSRRPGWCVPVPSRPAGDHQAVDLRAGLGQRAQGQRRRSGPRRPARRRRRGTSSRCSAPATRSPSRSPCRRPSPDVRRHRVDVA